MSTRKTGEIPKMSMRVEGTLLDMSTAGIGDMLKVVLLVTGVDQNVGDVYKRKICDY